MSMYINVKRLTQFSLTDNLLKFNNNYKSHEHLQDTLGLEASTRQRWKQCDGRSRRSKKPWKTTNVLAGQHLVVDWSIGR